MATEALRSQVAAKWQDSFTRLNRGEPGISGLMTFSQVPRTMQVSFISAALAEWTTGMESFH